MELRQLRYFAAVADELHFGRAAERLLIAQSAVSQQIRRLERELGVELFSRTSRTVRLTEAGTSFRLAARDVLDAERKAYAAVERFATGRRVVLRIGTSTGLGERLNRVLEELHRLAPDLQVELAYAPADERMQRVVDREWDATFLHGEVDGPDVLRHVPVWRDALFAALPARHPLAAGDVVTLGQLADLPLSLTTRQRNPPLVDLVVGACRDAGFEPLPGPFNHALQDTLASIGASRDGWTVLYASHVSQLRNDRVTFVPLLDTDGRSLGLPAVLAIHRLTPPEQLDPLLEACRAVARDDLDS